MGAAAVVEFYGPGHIGLRFGVRNAAHTTLLGHSGQDINGWEKGTWIPAFAAGAVVRRVKDADNPNDLGNFIVVESWIGGERYYITYCHLADLGGTPDVGDKIAFGQGVGPIGNTGYSKGTHLHAMMSPTSMYPNTRVRLIDPLPFILAARTAAAGGNPEPFPPTPIPTSRKVPHVLSINFVFRAGVGQYIMYTSATRVALTRELSTATPANRASDITTALALARAVGLPYTTEADIPTLDDSPNGGWYFRNQLAYSAAGMPSDYPLSPTTPWQIVTGAGGSADAAAIASAVDAQLADDFARVNANIDDLPTEFVVTPKG